MKEGRGLYQYVTAELAECCIRNGGCVISVSLMRGAVREVASSPDASQPLWGEWEEEAVVVVVAVVLVVVDG